MTMFSGFTPALVIESTQPLTSGVMHSSFHRACTIPMRSLSAPGNEMGAGAGPLMLAMFRNAVALVVSRRSAVRTRCVKREQSNDDHKWESPIANHQSRMGMCVSWLARDSVVSVQVCALKASKLRPRQQSDSACLADLGSDRGRSEMDGRQ